jgi:ferredoxin-NADP reductase/DMSO/TMAO reductase YedYZ heme-binding membrane subunit
MKDSDIRFVKFLVLVNAGVPGFLLAWDAFHHTLSANPVNFAILTTGMLALVFLILTLIVTPLRKITGWNWLIFSRRTFGLYAFFYAFAHFSIFFALYRSFSFSSTLTEMVKRKYLIIGSIGLLAMVPLAVTSTNAMIKRLGAKRWHALHRLTYVAAICGVIHYYMQVKADVRQPLAFAGALTILLGYRMVAAKKNAASAQPAGAPIKKIWSGSLRVARIIRQTPDVQTFRFASPSGGPMPFQHQPGQYLVISPVINGKKVNRPYTISSSPTQPDYCEITVKREDMGLVSRHLHDTLREGDTINIAAPTGRFIFDGTQAKSVVSIAGGVGITPLMAIARYLTDKGWKGDIYFAYSTKTTNDIIYRKELDDLKARFPNLHVHVTLSRADMDWMGHKGRVTAEFLTKCIPELPTRLVYICGPEAMMAMAVQVLKELGVPAEQIKLEEFVAAKHAEPATADAKQVCVAPADKSVVPEGGEPILTFSRSAKSVALTPDKSLLEIAEDAGVNIDFECRSGICGRCKTRLLGGCVTMETQAALDDGDRAKNLILMCQAHASEPVTVEA